jgi:hypothetical protein
LRVAWRLRFPLTRSRVNHFGCCTLSLYNPSRLTGSFSPVNEVGSVKRT